MHKYTLMRVHVHRMCSTYFCSKFSSLNYITHTELDVKSEHPAPWMADMLKVPGVRPKPYPAEMIEKAMKLMADGVPASKINEAFVDVLETDLGDLKKRYNWPDQTTHRRWRYGMAHVCRVQIGLELTKAAHNKKQVLTGDGTPVNGKHVESFVITTEDVKIAMIPWVQAGKGSQLSAENTVKMIDVCQSAYNAWYEKCTDKVGLPIPVQQGSLILNVSASVNDHAANETKRIEFISKIKVSRVGTCIAKS